MSGCTEVQFRLAATCDSEEQMLRVRAEVKSLRDFHQCPRLRVGELHRHGWYGRSQRQRLPPDAPFSYLHHSARLQPTKNRRRGSGRNPKLCRPVAVPPHARRCSNDSALPTRLPLQGGQFICDAIRFHQQETTDSVSGPALRSRATSRLTRMPRASSDSMAGRTPPLPVLRANERG